MNWPGSAPVAPQDLMNFPFLSNLATRALAYPSGDENVAGSVPGHVGGLVEIVAGDTGSRRSGRAAEDAAPALLPSSPIASSLRPKVRRTRAGLIELDDHPGGAVHHPDVVLRIDPDALRKQEVVGAIVRAWLPISRRNFPALVEFEQARAAVDVDARRANRGVRAAALVVDPACCPWRSWPRRPLHRDAGSAGRFRKSPADSNAISRCWA